jgi:hypothetical protein
MMKIFPAHAHRSPARTDRRALKVLFLAGCVFFLRVFPAAAQTEVIAVLEYCDYPDQIQIIDGDGFVVQEAYFGMDLGTGDNIKTANTSAEIRLTRNGSIIRLAPRTYVRIDSLEGSRGEEHTKFSLVEGKLRSVVPGTAAGKFSIQTSAGLCEAHGADFAVSVIGSSFDGAAVKAGSVAFSKNATRETITIGQGQAADLRAAMFRPEVFPEKKIEEIFYDLEFTMLDPGGVSLEPPRDSAALAQESAQPPEKAPEEPEYGSPEWLAELLRTHLTIGAQMGAVMIDRKTYARFVLEPVLTIDRFKLGLYFPFMFSGNILSPNDEFHPQGNDEWDFGTGVNQSHASDAGRKDFLRDLALKINFIEYGAPGESFFVKAGSFREMTLGHGSLMYKYANDSDFPTVRRVGLHMGVDAGLVGIEAVSADIAESDIFGGRAFIRPVSALPLSIGASAVVDKHPVYTLSDDMIALFPPGANPRDIDLLFTGFAVDADLRVLKTDDSSLTLFADAATLIPSLRHEYAASLLGDTRGFLFDAFYDESFAGKYRNYGLSGGVFGFLDFLDYRLEYRQYKGVFRPGFFGANYDRRRGAYTSAILDYLSEPEDSEYIRTGIAFYAEAGIHILDKLRLSAGYLLPGERDGTTRDEDYLELRFGMEKGFIPLAPLDRLSLSFEYIRDFFAPTFRDITHGRHADLVNAYTILKGEAAYAVTDSVDIAFSLSTAAERDADGYILYDADYNPEWIYVFALQARVRY